MILAAVAAGVVGLALGSFFNVVIWRLPRGESLAWPGSRCPRCHAAVRPRDNVPVVSWLALRGRCRDCGGPIRARYPLVEALTAVGLAGTVLLLGDEPELWLALAFVALSVPIVVIDVDHRIIPNSINLIGAVVGFVLVVFTLPDEIGGHLLAALIAGGLFLVAALVSPAGMGMGDVKLVFVMGLFLGRDVGPALLVGLLAGTLYGLTRVRREGRKATLPFGPFLVLGGLAGFLVGEPVVDWYLTTL